MYTRPSSAWSGSMRTARMDTRAVAQTAAFAMLCKKNQRVIPTSFPVQRRCRNGVSSNLSMPPSNAKQTSVF